MGSLQVIISPLKKPTESGGSSELKKLENRRNLKPSKIGRLMSEKLGTSSKTEAALYGFFRRGERAISDSRIPALAEIFAVEMEEIFRINALFKDQRFYPLELTFDSKLPYKDFLQGVPESVTALDEFLVWLSTESERRALMSRL